MSNQNAEEIKNNKEEKPIKIEEKPKEKDNKLNDSIDSIVQPNEINPNSQLRMDILKAFGADLNTNTRDNILFVNKALLYPCGRHLALRDLTISGIHDSHKNEQLFIFLESDVKEINCLNVSKDSYLLLVTTENSDHSEINIYNLSKISFSSFTIFKPRRKIMSSEYTRYVYACFTQDNNNLCTLGEMKNGNMKLVVYDIQAFKKFKIDNYTPKFTVDIPRGANKISFLNNKIFCISGKNCLSFWVLYESNCKEFKSTVNLAKNYVDHCWISDPKCPLCGVITDTNDLIIYTAVFYKNNLSLNEEDLNQPIERFAIKQTLNNIFNITTVKENYINSQKIKLNEINLICTRIKSFEEGLIIGSNKGNILFVEKLTNGDYLPIRFSLKDKESSITGICLETLNELLLVVGFKSNEIGYMGIKEILTNIKNPDYNLELNLICDGFHRGAINCMDVSLQRPIIITCSTEDKSIRIWNYLTGHCENCKIVLEEKEDSKEKEINFLALAIHPNGYYVAISDNEMIRFFHLCHKELRFYSNDQVGNEQSKPNCTILKFSNGGHLLAAVSERKIYVIRSFSREILRIFNTPHKGNIVSIYFHDEDSFIYSCGTDGIIVQYNLFNFDMVKLSNKLNTYNDSAICRNYVKINKFKQKIAQINNIVSVGYSPTGEYMLSNLKFEGSKTEEMSQVKYTYGIIDEHGVSCCHIHTKRYEIQSVVVGTNNGKVCLYSKKIENEPIEQDKTNHLNFDLEDLNIEEKKENPELNIVKFDSVISHSAKVNFLFFSRDTNLLFSAGDDGNIFIYAIYEYPDGECAAFDENRLVTIGQLNSILDEGLGDNVLMSLNEINANEEIINNKQEEISKLKKTAEESNKLFEKQLLNKEEEMNLQRESEINGLKKKIDEMINERNNLINEYEKKMEETLQEHRKKFNEREATSNLKIEELLKQITELKNLNKNMKNDYDKKLKEDNESQLIKFKELEFFLKKNVDEINKKNEKLEKNIEEAKNNEIKKMRLIENEHEYELKLKNEKFNEILRQNQQEIEEKINIIAKLNEKISKLEKSIWGNESSIKKYKDENQFLIENVKKYKAKLDEREKEKDRLTKNLNELEEKYQEKSKLENFSNQLKNELYKKNYELSAKFKKEVSSREELRNTSKTLENQLEDSINLLINREKEILKNKKTINEFKDKLESCRIETVFAQKEFDNLLRNIYDAFQTNDKKNILIAIKDIYKNYVENDSKKFQDVGKININVRIELEKQIEHLQSELDYKKEVSVKKGKTQTFEYRKKMEENAQLIQEMAKIKKLNAEMSNQIKNLKYKNITLSQTIERYKTTKKDKFYENKDKDKDIEALIQNSSTIAANNQSNLIYQSSYSQQNSSLINNGLIKANNSSASTSPSDILPIINNSQPQQNAGSLKNMKNRIYKPWDKKAMTQERLLKFNEMKKIIEGKNDQIQRLITENEFLKKNFGMSNKSKSP